MKKLILLVLLFATLIALVGCGELREPISFEDEQTLINLEECDYQLLIVTNRRKTDDGYEYQLREIDDESISDEWFYSDDFLSIGEYTVAIIYGEEVILVDLD